MLYQLLSRVSLRTLVFLGFTLAVLPLLTAVFFSVQAVDELAVRSRTTAYQVAHMSQKSLMLRERLTDLERRSRHFLVLNDPELREPFELVHRQVEQILAQLKGYTIDRHLFDQLQALTRLIQTVHQVVSTMAQSQVQIAEEDADRPDEQHRLDAERIKREDREVEELFARINGLGEDVWRRYAQLVDGMVKELEDRSNAVQRRILFQAAVLLPVSLLLISLFIYLITHPVRQLDRAIRRLGSGNYEDSIKVPGPRDLEYLGERLEWLRLQLNALEEAKQQFMRNVSHELKTPLATIHEGSTLIADQVVGELNQEQREIVEIVLKNSQKLERLIAELIHYSSANTHPVKRSLQRVDMSKLVQTLIGEFELRLRAKSIVLKQRLSPARIYGDADQLRTIVDNLLSNSVKYAPEGSEIEVNLTTGHGSLVLEIQDDGPGIKPEERSQVLEPFFRGQAGREMGVKGSGLGLAIVSECVANHGGTIEFSDPRPGKNGARVMVLLPLNP